jgi:hypothetical protein
MLFPNRGLINISNSGSIAGLHSCLKGLLHINMYEVTQEYLQEKSFHELDSNNSHEYTQLISVITLSVYLSLVPDRRTANVSFVNLERQNAFPVLRRGTEL